MGFCVSVLLWLAQLDRLACNQVFFFKQAPVMAFLVADQLDKAAALDIFRQQTPVLTLCQGRLQYDAVITLGLGRRDQVQYQLLWLALACQCELDFAALAIKHDARLHAQLYGQAFTLQRGIDTLAGIIIVVDNEADRIFDGNGQQGQAEDYREAENTKNEPGPGFFVPAAGGLLGLLHAVCPLLTDDGANEGGL